MNIVINLVIHFLTIMRVDKALVRTLFNNRSIQDVLLLFVFTNRNNDILPLAKKKKIFLLLFIYLFSFWKISFCDDG